MSKRIRIIAIILIAVILNPIFSHGDNLNSLNEYLEKLEDNKDFQGNILIGKDGEIIFNEAYGYSDRENNIKMEKTDRHQIGSITKQFVSLSIMQLEEKNKLKLDDSLDLHGIDIKGASEIEIHNLLSHSSGLVDFIEIPESLKLEFNGITQREVLETVKERDLKFNPGEKYEYCNTNYLILGIIIEEVSGLELGDYLKENIFKPLGMERTGLSSIRDGITLETKSTPFVLDLGSQNERNILNAVFGAGSMYSNVEDLFKWSEGFFNDKLIEESSKEKILTGHIDIVKDRLKSGYGWKVNGNEKYVYHNGQTPGWTSSIIRYVEEDLTIIILTNIGQFDINSLRQNIYNGLKTGDFKIDELNLNVNPKIKGNYRMKYGFPIRIYEKDGKYYGEILKIKSLKLFPMNNNRLTPINTGVQIEFNIDKNGDVKSLEIKALGIRALKVD